MNDRKLQVIKTAHQLFIEKGFQATSIQDILEYSGISKGTFYNYFSSKNELLIALFKSIHTRLETERNELLVGEDRSDIHIFIKQVELHLKTNRANKLLSLFEEAMVSNDTELKQFLKRNQLRNIQWIHQRFTDLFDERKKPYLLDCAVMFMGILQQNLRFNSMAYGSLASIHEIVRYSVDRILKIVEEVANSDDQLLQPSLMDSWLPDSIGPDPAFQDRLHSSVVSFKKALHLHEERDKYFELLDFIEEEILHSKEPRKHLIASALFSLKSGGTPNCFSELDRLAEEFFANLRSDV